MYASRPKDVARRTHWPRTLSVRSMGGWIGQPAHLPHYLHMPPPHSLQIPLQPPPSNDRPQLRIPISDEPCRGRICLQHATQPLMSQMTLRRPLLTERWGRNQPLRVTFHHQDSEEAIPRRTTDSQFTRLATFHLCNRGTLLLQNFSYLVSHFSTLSSFSLGLFIRPSPRIRTILVCKVSNDKEYPLPFLPSVSNGCRE